MFKPVYFSLLRFAARRRSDRNGQQRPPQRATWSLLILFGLSLSQAGTVDAKPLRFELASGFHQADPLFGEQLRIVISKLKDERLDGLRLRQSRKAIGASSTQMIDLMQLGSIDAVLIDPSNLGYRPAIAQIFGGLPFGPDAAQINRWASSTRGRTQIVAEFANIQTYPLICGHSERYSGVFARQAVKWPAQAHLSTVHVQGLASDTYQSLGFLTRKLPTADLYMGYATGVADFLVSANPAMDNRAGFGQVSAYFYYPSWERNTAFAIMLVSLKKWQMLPDSARDAIRAICRQLNAAPGQSGIESTLSDIKAQGTTDTVVEPWPRQLTEDAHQHWREFAARLVEQYPSLSPAFRALQIPDAAPRFLGG